MLFPVIDYPATLQDVQGHTVQYKRAASVVKYDFRGQMLTTYAGGFFNEFPDSVTIAGTLVLKTEARPGGRWVVVADTSGLKATRSGKAVPKQDSHLAFKGTWTQTVGGSATYTFNGKAVLPTAFTAPMWPISWMPIAADRGMTVGDSWNTQFSMPAQAFLEDDPIGWFNVPISFVFNGPDPFEKNLYSLSLKSTHSFSDPVKHPEVPDLMLTGGVVFDGKLKTRKDDGRLESANVIMSYDLTLENEEYPFGFSRARASITAVLQRIQ